MLAKRLCSCLRYNAPIRKNEALKCLSRGYVTKKKKNPKKAVEEIVNNILYDTPQKVKEENKRHILSVLVNNEAGVLSRVSGALAGVGFNLDSVVGARTESPLLSRMTIILRDKKSRVDNARKILEDLVPVWAVLDYTSTQNIERELLLIKVSLVELEKEEGIASSNNTKLLKILEIVKSFDGRVLDLNPKSALIELTAKSMKVNGFIQLLKPFGILDLSRSGAMVIPREMYQEDQEDEPEVSVGTPKVDATLLPPG
eukprot:TRINITY_DN2485_c0_g1_i1.p1 TRINITY_DN2485_c0_g1~~TRINITY_DN2485_c0_g1_i1.p1  ORF type:complete len:257 (+),score=47.92 TRINITY_DN2485_c0_g1_i1:125-895(+)